MAAELLVIPLPVQVPLAYPCFTIEVMVAIFAPGRSRSLAVISSCPVNEPFELAMLNEGVVITRMPVDPVMVVSFTLEPLPRLKLVNDWVLPPGLTCTEMIEEVPGLATIGFAIVDADVCTPWAGGGLHTARPQVRCPRVAPPTSSAI